MDRDTITALTIAVSVYRKLRAMGIYDMPLEFKGIKANALRLMANHDKLNKTLAGAVESSDKLISHVGDFKAMNDKMVDDIEFAANVLGNGSENGSGEAEKLVQPLNLMDPTIKAYHQENAQEAAGSNLAGTFPDGQG